MSSTGLTFQPPDLRRYLEVLAGAASDPSFLEIRYRVRDQSFASSFHSAADLDSVEKDIRARARDTDVYIGCAPRSRRAGTKDAIREVHTLWAECDGAQSARAALAWRPRPAMVVASGSGSNLHAYWPLTRPLVPRDAENANLRLAHAIGADLACFDVGRILRPPATWNHKHRPPRPVALLRLEPARFDPDAVLARAPRLDLPTIDRRWSGDAPRSTAADSLLRIPPAVYVESLIGRRPGRDGKVRCPFHDDDRPSLHVYATPQRGWTCFSCRRGGSIYDLAAELWATGTRGREFIELRRRLIERFGEDRGLGEGRTH